MSSREHVDRPAMACRLLLVVALLVGVASCGDFMTDAATRLAYEIEREAKELKRSNETTRTLVHTPKGSPEGVDGAYTVKLVLGHAGRRGLSVSGFNIAQQKQVGYGTTYHLNFVEVPKDLVISKRAGETVMIVLTRAGDAVQISELR